MDKDTFLALQELISFAQNVNDPRPTFHADAHYQAFQKVHAWMREAAKDIDDLDTLGDDDQRPQLKEIRKYG